MAERTPHFELTPHFEDVQSHYDLSDDFYRLFLDSTQT
jgi:cyclopropane-fatty-acyl-phospholipid synthase